MGYRPLMKLCFDATKFGAGLKESVELAHEKGIPSLEFSFSPFNISSKNALEVSKKEKAYLESLIKLGNDKGVEIASINLEYVHQPGNKKSLQKFVGMLQKLVKVADCLQCKRIGFHLEPGVDDEWKTAFEQEYKEVQAVMSPHDIKPVLRLSSPESKRGVSLKKWRAMEPQDWRDLLSSCPGLFLSFSPGDCLWLGIDYLAILADFAPVIENIEGADVEINRDMLKDSGMYGPLWWRYRLVGKGKVDWQQLIELLKLYHFTGTFSLRMDDEFIVGDTTSLEEALDLSIAKIAPMIKH